jgi:hypothetical protein
MMPITAATEFLHVVDDDGQAEAGMRWLVVVLMNSLCTMCISSGKCMPLMVCSDGEWKWNCAQGGASAREGMKEDGSRVRTWFSGTKVPSFSVMPSVKVLAVMASTAGLGLVSMSPTSR